MKELNFFTFPSQRTEKSNQKIGIRAREGRLKLCGARKSSYLKNTRGFTKNNQIISISSLIIEYF
jgi:hypothetical protein